MSLGGARRRLLAVALAMAVAGGVAATVTGGPVPPSAAMVLAPTLFAGWQTRNVTGPVVVRDPASGVWRMFYAGSATEQVNDAAWDLWATGLATSRDGRRWAYAEGYEPVLPARRFREGEVVDPATRSALFDSMEARAGAVLRSGGRWWMWYTGWNGDTQTLGPGREEKAHFRIGAAVSTDGRRWTKRAGAGGAGAVLGLDAPGGTEAVSVGSPSVLREAALFRMWHETSDGTTWRIALATSTDGVAWTKTGVVLEPGAPGSLDEEGARHPVVVALPSGYELWYQGRSRSAPVFHVLRARSADGRAWRKLGEVQLHPEPHADKDEDLHVGSVLLRADGRRDVFFSKETTAVRQAAFAVVASRTTSIYAETVAVRD